LPYGSIKITSSVFTASTAADGVMNIYTCDIGVTVCAAGGLAVVAVKLMAKTQSRWLEFVVVFFVRIYWLRLF
jgi:hypothetical protein